MATATERWERAQAEAQQWPIWLQYNGWNRNKAAMWHGGQLLSLTRRQNELLGGKTSMPAFIQRWWPAIFGYPFAALLTLFLPQQDLVKDVYWTGNVVYATMIGSTLTGAYCMNILPKRWWKRVYAQPLVISRGVDPTTGITRIMQIGQCPLPKLAFIGKGEGHYRGSARRGGVMAATIILDAGDRDLGTITPRELMDLPPARGDYIGTNARRARTVLAMGQKAADLYLDISRPNKLMTAKMAALGILLIITGVAIFNIVSGGGGIDIETIRSQLS